MPINTKISPEPTMATTTPKKSTLRELIAQTKKYTTQAFTDCISFCRCTDITEIDPDSHTAIEEKEPAENLTKTIPTEEQSLTIPKDFTIKLKPIDVPTPENIPTRFSTRRLPQKDCFTIVIIEDIPMQKKFIMNALTTSLESSGIQYTVHTPDKFDSYNDLAGEFYDADMVIMDNDLGRITGNVTGDILTNHIQNDDYFKDHPQPIIIKNSSDGFTLDDMSIYDASFGKCRGDENLALMKTIIFQFLGLQTSDIPL